MKESEKMFRGINVVSLSVTDLDRARSFYDEVLGFGTPIFDLPDAGWIEFSMGGRGSVSVVVAEPDWQPSIGTTLVLKVDDCTAAVTELRRHGIACDEPRVYPGFVTFASFYDPFGNRIQMCSPTPSSP